MSRFIRTVTKRFFIISNIVAATLFLLACLSAYCNPVTYWFIALLGVGFVFFAIIVLAFLVFWLLMASKWALLSAGTLLIGWSQIHALFAFKPFAAFNEVKQANALRVLTWNVSRWDEMNKISKKGGSYRLKMFAFIKSQNADILCVQEFFESRRPDLFDVNIPYIRRQLHYPYYFFASDHITWNGTYEHGVAIFSRYPIVDTFRMRYPGPDSLRGNESLIRATINVKGQKINVFTTHLQSFLFDGNDYRSIHNLKMADDKDSVVQAGRGIIAKFRKSYGLRSQQADIVQRTLRSSSYPEIICGDFNDVPNSYTYFIIRGNLQDAFVEKGFGLGRTFRDISPTLRIDYMLANSSFRVMQYKRTRLPYSDHFPLVADFEMPGSVR